MRLPLARSLRRSLAVRAALGLGLLAVILTGLLTRIFATETDPPGLRQAENAGAQGPVTMDIRAVFALGQPATDLTARELTVTIGGRTYPIQSMQLVDDTGSGQTGAGRAPTPVPPPFVTNAREGDGRAIYLLVDDESIDETGARGLASAVAAFLDTLSPGDEVALATTSYSTVGPTVDRSAVKTAVGAIRGRVGPAETPPAAAARSRSYLARVETLLDHLRGSPKPPIVVLLSGDLSASAVTGSGATGGRTTPPAPGRPAGTAMLDLLGPIRRAAGVAHAVLYVVALRPPTPGDGTATGLTLLASHLGVQTSIATVPEALLIRIAGETRTHYAVVLAGGAPTSADSSAITISTTRPWLAARATVWLAPTGEPTPTVEALLSSADEIRGFPVRTQAVITRGTSREAGKLAVTSFIGPVDSATRLVSVGSELLDASGGVVAKDLPSATLGAGPVAVSRLAAPPGRYRLRIAAVDAERRAGTVERPIEVGLVAAGPLKLGSLALGPPLPPSAAPPAPSRAGGRVELAAAPQPRFEFGAEAEALAFFDVYGGVANEQVTVVMELLRRPDGPPIQLLQPHIQAAAVGEPDHYRVFATVDLADLSPGDYLVRATVSLGGQPPGVLTQTLRKRAAGAAGGR